MTVYIPKYNIRVADGLNFPTTSTTAEMDAIWTVYYCYDFVVGCKKQTTVDVGNTNKALYFPLNNLENDEGGKKKKNVARANP